jgi:hypothetical protein
VGAGTTCVVDPSSYGIRGYSNATLRVTGGAIMRDSRFYFTLGNYVIADGGALSNSPTFYPGQTRTGIDGGARVWVTNGGSFYAGGDFWSGGGGNTWMTLSGSNSSIWASNSYIGNGSPYTELLVADGAWFNGGSTINVNHSGGAAKMVTCILSGDGSQFGRSNGVCNVTVKGGGHLIVGKGCETRVRLFNVNSGGRVTLDGVLRHNNYGSNIITLDAGAQVQGSGRVIIHPSEPGYFRSSATIHPGNPAGTLSLTGRWDEVNLNYSGTHSGNLRVELGGRQPGEYDRLSVFNSGNVKPFTFGGTCEVVRANGFLPKWGDVFKIVEWSKLTPAGAFKAVNLPPLRAPCEWVTNDLYTTGEIRVGGPEPQKGAVLMIH